MRYSIQKLDKDAPYRYAVEFRCKGSILAFSPTGVKNLHEVRRWLSDSYGWSDHIGDCVTNATNDYWTWQLTQQSHVIYLRDSEELMMLRLRFPIEDVE